MRGSLISTTAMGSLGKNPDQPIQRGFRLVSISVQVKQQIAFLKTLMLGQDATSSLRTRAIHSGAWIGAGFAVQKVLQLGSNLILTRLLFPEAFGLMALATVFLVGLAMFSDIGLKPAVIRDPRGDDPVFLNTAWTIQVIRGLILCVVGVAIAYPISLIYQQPILFPLLAVLSTTAAINGFSSISAASAERRLNFRTVTIIQLSGQLVSIGLLVTLAYSWRSVWALAAANVISALIQVMIAYALLPGHRHRLSMDREYAKSLINFGRWILLSTVVTYLGGEGLKAIQGGLLSPAQFGVLAIAYTIAGIPNDLAQKLAGSLGLPVLAEAYRRAPESAHKILHQLRQRTLFIALALFAAVACVAEPLISLMYDPRYHAAGSYLLALSIAYALAAVSNGYSSAFLAIGSSSNYFIAMSGATVLRIVFVVAGFEFNGIMGMLYAIGLANFVLLFLVGGIAYRLNLLDIKLDAFSIAIISAFAIAAELLHSF